jgi:hypothetical protein
MLVLLQTENKIFQTWGFLLYDVDTTLMKIYKLEQTLLRWTHTDVIMVAYFPLIYKEVS